MELTAKARLAWLAALIDGEGSIYISRHVRVDGYRRYRAVVVIASNTDYRLMEEIRRQIGVGSIYEHRVSNTRKSYNPRRNRQWTYRLNNEQILHWLPQILPFLTLKRRQAEIVLEVIRLKDSRDSRKSGSVRDPEGKQSITAQLDSLCAESRELNTRGRTQEVMPNGAEIHHA